MFDALQKNPGPLLVQSESVEQVVEGVELAPAWVVAVAELDWFELFPAASYAETV